MCSYRWFVMIFNVFHISVGSNILTTHYRGIRMLNIGKPHLSSLLVEVETQLALRAGACAIDPR